jgi:hypothetical protein
LKRNSRRIFGSAELVELFLQTNTGAYWHCAFNPAGSQYSARCTLDPKQPGYIKRDDSLRPELKTLISRYDKGWRIRGRIALKDLGVNTPVPQGTVWRVNFCSTSNKRSTSWTGQRVFNRPERFGKMRFAASPGVDYSVLEANDDGIRIKLRNNTSGNAKIRFAAGSALDKGVAETVSIKQAQTKIIQLKFIKTVFDNVTLSLSVNGKLQSAKNAILLKEALLTVTPNLYYFPETEKKIKVKINRVPKGSVRLQVEFTQNNKKLQSFSLPANIKDFELKVADANPGRAVISVSAFDNKKRLLDEDFRVVFLKRNCNGLPSLPKEKKMSLDGSRFMLNGKLFLPISGTGTSKKNYSPLARNCFNAQYGSLGICKNAPHILPSGLPWVTRKDGKVYFLLESDLKNFARVKNYLLKTKKLPTVYRRLRYEANIPVYRKSASGLQALHPPAEYEKLYKYLKELAPDQLFSIHTERPADVGLYTKCADVIEFSSWTSSYAKDKMLFHMEKEIRDLRSKIKDKALIWWLGASIPSPDARNAEKIRSAAFLSMMNDVNGLTFHLGHGGIPLERTRLWSVFSGMAKELTFIYTLLQEGKIPEKDFVVAEQAQVALQVRHYAGRLYVIVLNKAESHRRLAFKITGETDAEIKVLWENREVPLQKDGIWSDDFTALEPHVYEFRSKK